MSLAVTPEILTSSQVAAILRVDPKTVTSWAKAGTLPATRTLGGHHRFHARDVQRILNAGEVAR